MAVTVHIGYPKTGSSYLQRRVFNQLEHTVEVAASQFGPGRQLARNLASRREPTLGRTFVEFVRETEERFGNVLISHESIVGTMFDTPLGSGRQATNELASLLPDARILVFLREQRSMMRALHAQYVQEGGTDSLDAFCERERVDPAWLDYSETINHLDLLFDQVSCFTYESLRADPELTLKRLGSALDEQIRHDPSRGDNINVSVSGWRLRLLRGWNAAFRSSEHGSARIVAVPKAELMRVALQWRNKPSPTTTDIPVSASVLQLWSDSNRRLRKLQPDLLSHGEWL